MERINGIITLLVVMVLLQGCMPDNLTKFKEDSVKKEPVVVNIPTPSTFYTTFGSTAATRKMSIKLGSNAAFKVSGVTQVVSATGSLGTIGLADDSNNVYLDVPLSSKFVVGDSIDDGATFIKSESSVSEVNFVFSPNTTVDIVPGSADPSSLTSGVTFSISPTLPTGLSLNTTTGQISGSVASIQSIENYTLTVTGSSFTLSYLFGLGIVEAPEMLSLNKLQLIKPSNIAKFSVGDHISSSPISPLTDFGHGIVKYVDSPYLVVEILDNRTFSENQLVDNEETFVSSEGYISEEPEYFTSIITVPSTTGFTDYNNPTTAGFILCQSAAPSAKAIIKKINGLNLYVSQTKTASATYSANFSSAKTLYSDENCDTNNPVGQGVSSGAQRDIDSVWAPSVIATVASTAAFKRGYDVISTSLASGYVASIVDGTSMEIDISSNNNFDIVGLETIEPKKPLGSTVGSALATMESMLKFSLEVGNSTFISPSIYKGLDLFYTITPSLPDGLSLDSTTGLISGTPDKSQSKTTYTLVSKNIVGSQTITFDLEVNDYFAIYDATDGAPSYVLHKNGQVNNNTACRINKDDIANFNAGTGEASIVDIDCTLEGGESDLFNLGMSLKSFSGKGVCEFISYKPYSFYQYKPVTSNVTRFSKIDSNSCPTSTTLPANTIVLKAGLAYAATTDAAFLAGSGIVAGVDVDNICAYTGKDLNCDSGTVVYDSIAVSESATTPGDCVYTNNGAQTIKCDGKTKSCLQGPIREVLDDAAIETGYNAIITAANDGLNQTRKITSPNDKGYLTNRYITNSFKNNSCSNISAPTVVTSNGWNLYAKLPSIPTIGDYTTPLSGASPFYTFACLDSAYDIKARIRLTVREWDRSFNKSTGNIDSLYAALVDDNTLDFSLDSYNQVPDWDDSQLTGYSGCNATNAPTNATLVPYGYVQLPGLVSTTNGSTAMTGVSTNFDSYNLAFAIVIDPFVSNISDAGGVNVSDTSYTLSGDPGVTLTNVPIAINVNSVSNPSHFISGNVNELTITGTNFKSTLQQGMRLLLDADNSAGRRETVYIRSIESETSATIMSPLSFTHPAATDEATKEASYAYPGDDL